MTRFLALALLLLAAAWLTRAKPMPTVTLDASDWHWRQAMADPRFSAVTTARIASGQVMSTAPGCTGNVVA